LVYSWGEDALPSTETGLGYYFRQPWDSTVHYKFPQSIFNGVTSYNADSLAKLRKLYREYLSNTDTARDKKLSDAILSKVDIYRRDYISHNTLSYWTIKPLRDIKYLIFFSGTGYLPLPAYSACHATGKFIKLVFALLYYFILLTAFAGIILYFLFRRKPAFIPTLFFLSFVTMVGTMIFIGTLTVYSSSQEPRYFVQSFVMLIPFSVYFVHSLLFKRNIVNSIPS